MHNKRGALSAEMMVILVIAGLIMVVTLYWILTTAGKVGARYEKNDRSLNAQSCQAEGSYKQGYFDKDKDQFPDGCDFCLGGDDKVDQDADSIPDACDNDRTAEPEKGKGYKEICEAAAGTKRLKSGITPWDDKRKRCILPSYI